MSFSKLGQMTFASGSDEKIQKVSLISDISKELQS